jgi:hypothetical protein
MSVARFTGFRSFSNPTQHSKTRTGLYSAARIRGLRHKTSGIARNVFKPLPSGYGVGRLAGAARDIRISNPPAIAGGTDKPELP